jgi:hypothetical protein
MTTEHQIEIDTLKNTLVEEREIAINSVEVKAYE